MTTVKKISTLRTTTLLRLLLFLLLASLTAQAQTPSAGAQAQASSSDGIALGPARFELEMSPGSETTVVVNLDYHTTRTDAHSYRLVASLNDWNINQSGELEFYRAGTRPNSASPWIIYSPAEVAVLPGQTHSIRVTITVPKDAAPGDHLAALVVEQRPDTIKLNRNARQMLMRFRMAAMFYIMVPQLTRRATLANLQATAAENGILVTPTLKNEGNSMIRPLASVKVMDSAGHTVAELPEAESLPLLGGSELSQQLRIEKTLPPGTYTVRYRVDFQNGGKVTEGVTDLVVKESLARKPSASSPLR
jgi:methionine-rich copper-binding protein CopC